MNIIQFSKTDFEPVELTHRIHERIKVEPVYFNQGFSPCPLIYGRRIIRDSLVHALDALPEEYGFLIWDVYRPREIQTKLFQWMREKIRLEFPHLSDEEHDAETQKYISPPSKIGDEYCSPHLSGGSIDLTLFETQSGKPVNMGTPFDDFTERAHRDFFHNKSLLTDEEKAIQQHRVLLRSLMEDAGFTSYQFEWWHFDIGNFFWSRHLNCPAVFGPLFGDEEWPDQIQDFIT